MLPLIWNNIIIQGSENGQSIRQDRQDEWCPLGRVSDTEQQRTDRGNVWDRPWATETEPLRSRNQPRSLAEKPTPWRRWRPPAGPFFHGGQDGRPGRSLMDLDNLGYPG